MLKPIRFVTTAPLVLLAAFALADQAEDVKAIEAQYGKLKTAIAKKDMKAIMALCTTDFAWVDMHGHSMPRKEFEGMMAGQLSIPGLKFHKVVFKNDSFGFMGKECRVRSTGDMAMSALMQGKRMHMTGITESVDTWRRTAQGWKMCLVEVTSETQKYGGG